MKRKTKMSLNWHKANLNNMENYLSREICALESKLELENLKIALNCELENLQIKKDNFSEIY